MKYLYEMNETISKERLSSKNLYLNKFINKKQTKKKEIKPDDNSLIDLRNSLKIIDYTDIIFDLGDKWGPNEQFYNIGFKDKSIDVLLTYAKNYAVSHKIVGEKINQNKFDISVSVNKSEFNRVHFHKALPKLLRGIGFGYKIYKSLGMELGYISSDNTASMSAQSVWYHLVQDSDFNHIISKNFVLIINKNIPIDLKINIVKSYMTEYSWLFEDESEFDIDDELIQELEKYGNT